MADSKIKGEKLLAEHDIFESQMRPETMMASVQPLEAGTKCLRKNAAQCTQKCIALLASLRF